MVRCFSWRGGQAVASRSEINLRSRSMESGGERLASLDCVVLETRSDEAGTAGTLQEAGCLEPVGHDAVVDGGQDEAHLVRVEGGCYQGEGARAGSSDARSG